MTFFELTHKIRESKYDVEKSQEEITQFTEDPKTSLEDLQRLAQFLEQIENNRK